MPSRQIIFFSTWLFLLAGVFADYNVTLSGNDPSVIWLPPAVTAKPSTTPIPSLSSQPSPFPDTPRPPPTATPPPVIEPTVTGSPIATSTSVPHLPSCGHRAEYNGGGLGVFSPGIAIYLNVITRSGSGWLLLEVDGISREISPGLPLNPTLCSFSTTFFVDALENKGHNVSVKIESGTVVVSFQLIITKSDPEPEKIAVGTVVGIVIGSVTAVGLIATLIVIKVKARLRSLQNDAASPLMAQRAEPMADISPSTNNFPSSSSPGQSGHAIFQTSFPPTFTGNDSSQLRTSNADDISLHTFNAVQPPTYDSVALSHPIASTSSITSQPSPEPLDPVVSGVLEELGTATSPLSEEDIDRIASRVVVMTRPVSKAQSS